MKNIHTLNAMLMTENRDNARIKDAAAETMIGHHVLTYSLRSYPNPPRCEALPTQQQTAFCIIGT